jgi:hypothetical protein
MSLARGSGLWRALDRAATSLCVNTDARESADFPYGALSFDHPQERNPNYLSLRRLAVTALINSLWRVTRNCLSRDFDVQPDGLWLSMLGERRARSSADSNTLRFCWY